MSGQIAYDAYCSSVGGKAFNGDPLPAWEGVRPNIQQAWEHAAKVVLRGGDIDAQALKLPSADAIWGWAIANSANLAQAIQRAIDAEHARDVWGEVKDIGDILMDLFDPEVASVALAEGPGSVQALGFAENIPWDQVVSVLLPAILDLIRRRRAERGAK